MEESKKPEEEGSEDYKRYIDAADPKRDEVSIILRTHLLAEYYIDQILSNKFNRADILLESQFSFTQKLIIVESLGILPPETVTVLKNLNKVRNNCSHQLNYQVTEEDLNKMMRPVWKRFMEMVTERKINTLKGKLHWGLALPIIDLTACYQIHKGDLNKN